MNPEFIHSNSTPNCRIVSCLSLRALKCVPLAAFCCASSCIIPGCCTSSQSCKNPPEALSIKLKQLHLLKACCFVRNDESGSADVSV